ncbi:hypothetical protein DEJ51_26820 [Streptomyces venezuelae]|uniref:Uncharacterized protein n=1 Tax=Streptomyces venezuelae TaxID=54571 RepID=A0A5P2DS19_STRVZ|nr:hypothetical protein [Streptomyces venezuelae]QES57350.1 hypothetical protein DEJ51_26820 [Streptomyces venezuelae]
MAHAEEIGAAGAEKSGAVMRRLGVRRERGGTAPLPAPVVEVLVMGPHAEAARRRPSGTCGIDLTEAARPLPGHIWRSPRPEPA